MEEGTSEGARKTVRLMDQDLTPPSGHRPIITACPASFSLMGAPLKFITGDN